MRLFNEYLIDGKPIITPNDDAVVSRSDLDSPDTGRDESGIMHRFVIRYRVRYWEISYSTLTKEEYKYMLSLFEGKAMFRFSYKDLDGSVKVTDAYCSNDSVVYQNAVTGEYKNLKLKIVEC